MLRVFLIEEAAKSRRLVRRAWIVNGRLLELLPLTQAARLALHIRQHGLRAIQDPAAQLQLDAARKGCKGCSAQLSTEC